MLCENGLGALLKLHLMFLLRFSTARQIFYIAGSNILQDPTRAKACFTAADLIASHSNICIASCCF